MPGGHNGLMSRAPWRLGATRPHPSITAATVAAESPVRVLAAPSIMIVSATSILHAPEAFSDPALVNATAASSKEGLQMSSGLGGSYNVRCVGRGRAPDHLQFECSIDLEGDGVRTWEAFTLTARDAARRIYSLHPGSPFLDDRPLPLNCVIAVPARLSWMSSRLPQYLRPETRFATLTAPGYADTQPIEYFTTIGGAEGTELMNRIVAGQRHTSLVTHPIFFLSLLTAEANEARPQAASDAFTFEELAFEMQYGGTVF